MICQYHPPEKFIRVYFLHDADDRLCRARAWRAYLKGDFSTRAEVDRIAKDGRGDDGWPFTDIKDEREKFFAQWDKKGARVCGTSMADTHY